MKIYITFGQCHAHRVSNHTLDKDTIAEIECTDHADGRTKAFELFGNKFGSSYSEDQLDDTLKYFPRGVIKI